MSKRKRPTDNNEPTNKRPQVRQFVANHQDGSQIDKHRRAYEYRIREEALESMRNSQERADKRRQISSISRALDIERRQRKAHIDRHFKHGRPEIYQQHLEHLDSLMNDMKKSALRQIENKRTRTEAQPETSAKRRKKSDPAEQKLDEIDNMVRYRPRDHRATHRLKFLVYSLGLLRLTDIQRQRLQNYMAISHTNGWRLPNMFVFKSIFF